MALALLKLPLSVLALLVVGLPVLLAVVGLLLVRSRVPHPRLQPHHDVAGYIRVNPDLWYHVPPLKGGHCHGNVTICRPPDPPHRSARLD
jgi:hypothetical protein